MATIQDRNGLMAANDDTVQYLARIVSDPILLLTAVQELRLYASQWDAAGDSVDQKLLIGQRLRQGVAGLERQIKL